MTTVDAWPRVPYVLGFSGAILSLAIALPVFALLAGSVSVFRASLIAAAGRARYLSLEEHPRRFRHRLTSEVFMFPGSPLSYPACEPP